MDTGKKKRTHQPLIKQSVSVQIQKPYLGLKKDRVQSGCLILKLIFQFAGYVIICYAYFHNMLFQSAFPRCFLAFINIWVSVSHCLA